MKQSYFPYLPNNRIENNKRYEFIKIAKINFLNSIKLMK